MDRVPKKLRPFFDVTLKNKHRVAALLSFIEGASESEQRSVYKEYSDIMVTFILETHNVLLERLSMDREFSVKFEKSLSKDVTEYLKVPLLFDKILKYLRVELTVMPHLDQLVNIVRMYLHPGNHPVLRREGVKLLMSWMREEASILPETLNLFASCVPLSVFIEDESIVEIEQESFPLSTPSEPPMFPAPVHTTPMDQAIVLLTEMLDFLTLDNDADRVTTYHLYSLFRKYYLEKFYPEASSDKSKNGFIAGCPSAVQAVLMPYIAMWTVQSPDLFNSRPGLAPGIPVATFILQECLLTIPEDLALIHLMIGQCLELPPGYRDIVRMGISILRTWTFTSKERRPDFLQENVQSKTTVYLTEKFGVTSVLNYYLQEYMKLMSKLLLSKPVGSDFGEQVALLREGIYFLRGMTMKAFFTLNQQSWSVLLDVILVLVEEYLVKQRIRGNSDMDEFTQLLMETMFGVWVRSETMVKDQWERLCAVLIKCTGCPSVIVEWGGTVMQLTSIMADVVFQSTATTNSTSGKSEDPTRRRNIRNGCFEADNLIELVMMETPISKAMARELYGLTHQLSVMTIDNTINNDTFLAWRDLPWVRENVVFLWRNMLRVLGDVNAITNAEMHRQVISIIVGVTEKLLQIREGQSFTNNKSPIPPVFEMAITLLDACDLPPKGFEASRCLAYSAICRLFCRHNDVAYSDVLLERFYLALLRGLSDKDDNAAWVILVHASHLLNRSLPGASLLMIQPLLKCLAGILNSQVTGERRGALVPMMRLAGNAAVMPGVLPSVNVSRLEAPLPVLWTVPISLAGEVDLGTVKMQVRDLVLMMTCQEAVRKDFMLLSSLSNMITVLLITELLSYATVNLNSSSRSGTTSPTAPALIDSYLGMLLEMLLPRDGSILPIMADHFYALAQLLPLVGETVLKSRQVPILERLIMSCDAAIDSGLDEIAARMMFVVLEWLILVDRKFLTDHPLIKTTFFNLIDKALTVLNDETTAEQSLVKEAGEYILLHLQNHLFNYSPEFGPTVVSSLVPEPAWHVNGEDRALYFSYGGAILTMQQRQKDEGVRIIGRNAGGRFVWDAQPICSHKNDKFHNEMGLDISLVLKRLKAVPRTKAIDFTSEKPVYVRNVNDFPVYEDGKVDLEVTDMLGELLEYIGEEHPECVNKEKRVVLTQAEPIPEERLPHVMNIASMCTEQIDAEIAISTPYHLPIQTSSATHSEYGHPVYRITTASNTSDMAPYQQCRQLLTSLGMLPLDDEPVYVLARTAGMKRDLKGLDQKFAREVIKIALIFVAPGQEEESQILSNDLNVCTPAYDEFVKALGWRVDLTSHVGYTGGLEPGMTVGNEALYHCTSTVECVYHESVNILTDEQDVKMLKKKRHIGNDYVHIVWNEHGRRDYKATTMRGDFGLVQIIVTPLPELKMYRVNVWREAGLPTFGPLYDGIMVPRCALTTLVRTTAINANRTAILHMNRPSPMRPAMWYRYKDISMIVKRHAQHKWSCEQFLAYTMFANNPLVDEMPPKTVSE